MNLPFHRIVLGMLVFTIGCKPVSSAPGTMMPSLMTPPSPISSTQPALTATLSSPTGMPTATNSLEIGDVIATIPVGPLPGGNLAVGAGSVWVPNSGNSTVSRIDPQTNQVVATIEIGERGGSYGSPLAVAVNNSAVWVTDNAGLAIVRIDPTNNQVVARIPLERTIAGIQRDVEPYYISADDEAVWVTGLDSDSLIRIDPETNEVIASFKVPSPSGIAIVEGAVWVANHREGTVSRVDPQTNQVTGIVDVPGGSPEAIAVDTGAVWVTDSVTGAVTRIDAETNLVVETTPSVGARANGIAVGGGAVWVTSFAAGTLTQIDPATNRIVGSLELSPAVGVVFTEGSVWVGDIHNSSVLRITPLP